MICIRCKNTLDIEYDTKTCETCIKYIDESLVCGFGGDSFTRTNKSRHQSPFKCQSRHGELYSLFYKDIEYKYRKGIKYMISHTKI